MDAGPYYQAASLMAMSLPDASEQPALASSQVSLGKSILPS